MLDSQYACRTTATKSTDLLLLGKELVIMTVLLVWALYTLVDEAFGLS